MAFTRKNVWQNGGTFDDPTILWYARGVKAMRARALNDTIGWRFYAAIHGFNKTKWQQHGYFSAGDRMPNDGDIADFWDECQHGSWYFLPWHRGYLIALETVIRDAIKNIPGAPSDWALPYWNYFNTNQNALPPAFASADWPDGQGDNPLFEKHRYGPFGDGKVFVPTNMPDVVNLNELGDDEFTGAADGGSVGFGGVETTPPFSHAGDTHGGLESQPHDQVHGLVGGRSTQTRVRGLMSDPDTAGLDPIFYLHHANIDRLWEVWRNNPTTHVDPPDANWLKGPAIAGDRAFVLPLPGGVRFSYTPADMSDLSKLTYVYDDVSPPAATPQAVARLERLGVAPRAAAALARSTAMAGRRNVELLGANTQSIRLTGNEARTSLSLEPSVKNKVTRNLTAARAAAATAAPAAPDRIFLNLENVRGVHDGTVFRVYINVPEGADPAQYPDHVAGSIGLFGVSKASVADDKHAGEGLTYVLEISRIVDALHLSGALDAGQIHVRLVPLTPIPDEEQISIGRISVYRQGS
jgi:tyrosinase